MTHYLSTGDGGNVRGYSHKAKQLTDARPSVQQPGASHNTRWLLRDFPTKIEHIAKGIYVNNLTEKDASSQAEVLDYMMKGDEVRNVAETKLNENSSRSHTVFRINIELEDRNI